MNAPAPRITHLAARALLALVFLCVQQSATLHWLSHSVEATRAGVTTESGDKGAPVAHHCDTCLAFSAFGAASVAKPVVVAVVLAPPAGMTVADADAPPTAPQLAFRSRAPPILI